MAVAMVSLLRDEPLFVVQWYFFSVLFIFAYGRGYVKMSQKLSHPCGPTRRCNLATGLEGSGRQFVARLVRDGHWEGFVLEG
jgi:hypothetical protein